MCSRPEMTHEWSVHAQVTISHHGDILTSTESTPETSTTTTTNPDGNGVRMVYSWHSHPQAKETPPEYAPTPDPSKEDIGFRRGNMTFTSAPTGSRPFSFNEDARSRLGVPTSDSGYNSELLSPSQAVPPRSPQPYNRRCKSTCSIILSTTTEQTPSIKATPSRSQSLRTPTNHRSSEYDCNDPWCYHTTTTSYIDDAKTFGKQYPPFSPVSETCEDCGGGRSPNRPSRAHTFSTHFCTKVPEKTTSPVTVPTKLNRDVSVQTMHHEEPDKGNEDNKEAKKRNRIPYDYRRITDSVLSSPTFLKSFGGDSRSPGRRLSRSPGKILRNSPPTNGKSSDSSNKSSTDSKKPRTVHIDVYCTGSEEDDQELDETSSSEENASSPQTVFESEKMRVIHKRAGKNDLPKALLKNRENLINKSIPPPIPERDVIRPVLKRDISEDGLSTGYPSQASSYSTIRDMNSSLSSVPPSWSTMSNSSWALFGEDYDSATATSWKDTDIESLMQSGVSLAPSDSFEYADEEDRDRIKLMEKLWEEGSPLSEDNTKKWRSPQVERKFLLQQQKMNEYLDRRNKGKNILPKWVNDSDESLEGETDDDAELAWTFNCDNILGKSSGITKKDTIRRASREDEKEELVKSGNESTNTSLTVDTGSLSDSSPSTVKSYAHRQTIGPFGAKLGYQVEEKMESSCTSPFASLPGFTTDHMAKAMKFGTIVGVLRKPGHHVGPAKNPDCSCEHCRRYFEDKETMYRNRTRSVGDAPLDRVTNWRQRFKTSEIKEQESLKYTDY